MTTASLSWPQKRWLDLVFANASYEAGAHKTCPPVQQNVKWDFLETKTNCRFGSDICMVRIFEPQFLGVLKTHCCYQHSPYFGASVHQERWCRSFLSQLPVPEKKKGPMWPICDPSGRWICSMEGQTNIETNLEVLLHWAIHAWGSHFHGDLSPRYMSFRTWYILSICLRSLTPSVE